MENNYAIGEVYDLTFQSIIVKDGSQYIVVSDDHDDYTVKPYDYQVEYSTFPHFISCFVKKIGLNGKPYFEQNRESVLKDRYYQFDKIHQFSVDVVCLDTYSNTHYYILSDEYGISHRYYQNDGGHLLKSGDNISLIVKGIVPAQQGKNNARLQLEAIDAKAKRAELVYTTQGVTYPKMSGYKYFGVENEKTEFKSSIVYPAGETGPNIDKQLGIICRTIAGFMNANGGTLYIGMGDNGYVCGIENDYSHLNEGDVDFDYKANDDHYVLRITNYLCKILGRIAGTLVNINIEQDNDKKYCVVNIKKASRPVWFDGNKLFVRIVNTNRMMKNDEVTQFVLERVSKSSFEQQREQEQPATEAPESQQTFSSSQASSSPELPANTQIAVKKAPKAWRVITFFRTGEWSFQKDELQGADVVCNAIIPCDARQNALILIIAYSDGHVEATQLRSIMYGKSGLLPEGTRRGHGLHLSSGNPVSVFCVKKKDMLILTSEVSGERYVKALDVDTLGIHDRMGKGNSIIREDGAVLIKATHVPDDVGKRVALKGSGIFIEKNQKYTKGGVRLSSLASNYRDMINEL